MSKANWAPELEKVIKAIEWTDGQQPVNLALATDLGCLVLRGDDSLQPDSLIMFSSFETDKEVVQPPLTVTEARERLEEPPTISMFSTDLTAKGLGFSGANTPLALQHPDQAREIAVRAVPLPGSNAIHERPEKDTRLAGYGRWLRHLVLMGGAFVGDFLPNAPYLGTSTAIKIMERKYGDATAVLMPSPPSWQYAQRKLGITHPIPPRKILVRGSVELPKIGTTRFTNLAT